MIHSRPASSLRLIALLLLAVAAADSSAQQPVIPGDGTPGVNRGDQALEVDRSADRLLVNAQPTFLSGLTVNHADAVYRAGDPLSVSFQAERDAYLYLLYHQVDGGVFLLYPNAARRDNRVRGKTRIHVPDNQEPFQFRVRGPFGREVLQVLASVAPIPELDERITAARAGAPQVDPELLLQVAGRLRQNPSGWSDQRVVIYTLPEDRPRPALARGRLGLFIGIGKYHRDDLGPPHPELRRSAEVMHRLMLNRGGLDPERTRLVVDSQATRANLETLIFRWLPSVSRPGDTVFLYFSGHAGQTPTDSEDEPDGQDETLAPYDIDNGTADMPVEDRLARLAKTEIRDDTLARWIQELHGRQVVLILDTCHSGGVVQGKGLAELLRSEANLVKDISQLNTVVLTSCAADEQALFEGTPDQTMWFTYFLTQAIERNRPLTVQQAHRYAAEGMKEVRQRLGESRVQTPTLTDNGLIPIHLVP